MNQRLHLAAYLAHMRRAEGSWPADWTFARLASNEARQLLQQYLTSAKLPHALTIKAYAASEDLRARRHRLASISGPGGAGGATDTVHAGHEPRPCITWGYQTASSLH